MIQDRNNISWINTFFLITTNAATEILSATTQATIASLHAAQEDGGTMGIARLCIELTDRFESEYRDEDWATRDYFDTVDLFTRKYFKNEK